MTENIFYLLNNASKEMFMLNSGTPALECEKELRYHKNKNKE
jgi:hypothetical protein